MNTIAGLLIAVLGMVFALRPRTLWRLRWGWSRDREPTCGELLLSRACGGAITMAGVALALFGPL